MFQYGISMYEKAEEYKNTVLSLVERGVYNSGTIVLCELTMECYLSSILETLAKKDCDSIFGRGNVPHDMMRMYRNCYRYDTEHVLPPFSRKMQQQLGSAFMDYNASRFPRPNQKRIVNEESIDFNMYLMENVSKLASSIMRKCHNYPETHLNALEDIQGEDFDNLTSEVERE